MKKTIFLFLLLVGTLSINAQKFEGTIKMKLSFKGAAAQMMQAMSPSEMIFKMSNDKMSTKFSGGMSSMMGKIISDGEKDYMIMDSQKTAYLMDNTEEESVDNEPEPKITDLNITEKVAGYDCKKFKVELPDTGEDQQVKLFYVWIAQNFNAKFYSPDMQKGSSNAKVYEKLNGFPFKQEILMNSEMGEITTINEVSEVTKEKIDASEFKVPDGYTIKPMSEFNMFGN